MTVDVPAGEFHTMRIFGVIRAETSEEAREKISKQIKRKMYRLELSEVDDNDDIVLIGGTRYNGFPYKPGIHIRKRKQV